MKRTYSRLRTKKGSTLVLAVFVVVLLSIFIGLALDYTANTRLISQRARDYSNAQALANGALETVFQQWQLWMKNHQASNIPTSTTDPSYGNSSSYTSATQLQNLIATTTSIINTAVANTGYQVIALTLKPVDQAGIAQPCQLTTYASVAPMSDNRTWNTTTYTYTATATVSKVVGQVPTATDPNFIVSVQRNFTQNNTSLFQALFFFRDDLEINPGSNMNINGPIFTDGHLFLASCLGGVLTLHGAVNYSGGTQPGVAVVPRASQPTYSTFANTPTGQYYDPGDGYTEGVNQPTYNSGSQWKNGYAVPVYDDGLGDNSNKSRATMLSRVSSLDPININPVSASGTSEIDSTNANTTGGTHEIIERPVPISSTNPDPNPGLSDPSVFAAHRLYNSANLRVIINRNGVGQKIHVYMPSQSNANPEYNQEITPGSGTAASPLNIANYIINSITLTSTDPLTNVVIGQLFDFRQFGLINVSTIDMSQLTPHLNDYVPNALAPNAGIVLYITDATNAGPNGNMGSSDAIRLVNGGTLPNNGLSVVTDGALYVQGDYNTGTTYTTDSTGKVSGLGNQPDSDKSLASTSLTTVTGYTQKPAAVIGDAVTILSNNWKDATSGGGDAVNIASSTTMNAAIVSGIVTSTSTADSGGAQNFPRFLENWYNKNFAYLGSMCELYASTDFTGPYGRSNVYIQPIRNWQFDKNLLINPPPGNLNLVSYSRGLWSRNGSP